MKTCNTCNTEKPQDDFYLYRNGKHRKTTCKACEKKRASEWQKKNKDVINKRRMERYFSQKKS